MFALVAYRLFDFPINLASVVLGLIMGCFGVVGEFALIRIARSLKHSAP